MSETTFDGTLISGMSFETLASEDFSATRLTATSAAKRTISRMGSIFLCPRPKPPSAVLDGRPGQIVVNGVQRTPCCSLIAAAAPLPFTAGSKTPRTYQSNR